MRIVAKHYQQPLKHAGANKMRKVEAEMGFEPTRDAHCHPNACKAFPFDQARDTPPLITLVTVCIH